MSTEHRIERRGPERKFFCAVCGVRWPCLAYVREVLARMHAS
jgi:hypothetical protein